MILSGDLSIENKPIVMNAPQTIKNALGRTKRSFKHTKRKYVTTNKFNSAPRPTLPNFIEFKAGSSDALRKSTTNNIGENRYNAELSI